MIEAGLLHCPTDLLLEITTHLELPDVFILLSVSSVLYKLSTLSSLWIDVLTRTELYSRPISCPAGTNLSELDVGDLHRIAIRTHQLQLNWGAESPRILVKRELDMRGWTDIRLHFAIPGESMFVVSARSDGPGTAESLLLYSLAGETLITEIHSVGTTIQGVVFYNRPGRCVIAVSVYDLVVNAVSVHSVTYGKSQSNKVECLYQKNRGELLCAYGLFISEDVVGFAVHEMDEGLCIHAINVVTQRRTVIRLLSTEDTFYTSPSVAGRTLILATSSNDPRVYQVYRCPPALLPYTRGPNGTAHDTTLDVVGTLPKPGLDELSPPTLPNSISLRVTQEMKSSTLGIYAISICRNREFFKSFTTVHFWPYYEGGMSEEHYACFPEIVAQAKFDEEYKMYLSSSGYYAALVVKHRTGALMSEDGEEIVFLAFVTPGPPKIDARRILVPYDDNYPGAFVKSVIIDERDGLLYLSMEGRDVVTVMSFV